MSSPIMQEDLTLVAEIRELFRQRNLSRQERELVLRYILEHENCNKRTIR